MSKIPPEAIQALHEKVQVHTLSSIADAGGPYN